MPARKPVQSATPAPPAPRMLYSRAEAAYQLSMSTRRLDRLIASKQIAAMKDGRSVKIRHGELVRYSRAHHQAA